MRFLTERYHDLHAILRYYEACGYTHLEQRQRLHISQSTLRRYQAKWGIREKNRNTDLRNQAILGMDTLGFDTKEIMCITGLSRASVRRILRQDGRQKYYWSRKAGSTGLALTAGSEA